MALTIQRKSLFKGRILTTSLMALALMLQPFYILAAGQVANAATPSTVVNKENHASTGWHIAKVGASVDFVPTSGALGSGALKMSKGNVTGDYAQVYREAMSPMELSDISFKYSSKRLAGSNVAAPGFGITIDTDGDFATTDDVRWYMYEPTYNSSVTDYNVWNDWSIDTSSKVWQLSRPTGSPWVLHTIGDLSTASANARVKDYWLNIGTGGNGTSVLVDQVIEGDSVTYNFEPLVIEPCLTPTNKHFTSLDGWDPGDTRATGHNQIVASGLRVWTEGATSTDKAAGYYPVDFALKNLGANTNDILDITTNAGTTQPGGQLVVDFDGDGTNDGILVGEPTANGYGNNWWLNNAAKQEVKDNAPHNGGGYGSPWYGDANEWLNAFPSARVKAIGYSLGSGVYGDHIITKISAGCVNYTFGPEAPTVTIATPSQGAVVATTRHGNTLAVSGKFTDDKAVNYLQLELVRAGNLVTVYTMHYNNPGLGADGSFAIKMPVPASLESGDYTLHFTGTDFDGGVTQRFARNFVIDNTNPETTLIVPSGTVGPSFTVNGVAKDNQNLNRVYVQLVNRQNNQRYGGTTIHLSGTEKSWSRAYDAIALNLPDGDYAAHVSVVDNVGNTASVGWSTNFTIDRTAPSAPVLSATGLVSGDHTRNSSVNLNWTKPDGTVKFEYLYWNDIDGNQWKVSTPWKTTLTGQSRNGAFTEGQGTHYMQVIAIDAVGNRSEPSNTFEVTYDITAPSLAKILSPSNGSLFATANNLEIELEGKDAAGLKRFDVTIWEKGDDRSNGETMKYSWGGNVPASEATDYSTFIMLPSNLNLDDGEYTIYFTATDLAGNSKDSANVDFTIDSVNPTVSATMSSPALTVGDSVTVTVTADDASGINNVEYKIMNLDGTTAAGWFTIDNGVPTDAPAISGLAAGNYILRARAFDNAGNKKSGADVVFTISEPDIEGDNNEGEPQGPGSEETEGSAPTNGEEDSDDDTIDNEDEGESPNVQPFINPVFGFAFQPLPGQDAAQNETETDNTDEDTTNDDNGDVLGEQDQAGTPLEDTGEVLGLMDHKWFGIAWYWFLIILGGIIGAWLMLAAAIRRHRGEEA